MHEYAALENYEYQARNLWMTEHMRAVYGGQVMGQALMSAWMCVSELDRSFLLHSFHCYFVGPMQATPEVTYKVTRVKDGKNFCSVSVAAVQKAKVCFHCLVSFEKSEGVKSELNHCAHTMPLVPRPHDESVPADLNDDDMFTINPKKMMFKRKHQWSSEPWLFEMVICTDVKSAKKVLAREPVAPV